MNDNVDYVGKLLCYDVDGKDGKTRLADIRAMLQADKQAASIWSTHGHSDKQEKLRVVLFTNANIPTKTLRERVIYEEAYALIGNAFFGEGVWDTSCTTQHGSSICLAKRRRAYVRLLRTRQAARRRTVPGKGDGDR